MDYEILFMAVLGLLALTGLGLFIILLITFKDDGEIYPIYRQNSPDPDPGCATSKQELQKL